MRLWDEPRTLNDRTGTGTLTDRPSLRIFHYGTETLTGRAALRDGDGGAYGTSLLTGLLYLHGALRDELTGQASSYGSYIITDGGASCRFLIGTGTEVLTDEPRDS